NAAIEVVVDATSIDTRNADRDGHLKSNDFFEMETYPEITFRSTKVSATGSGSLEVTGDLTIKGTTRSITIPFDYEGTATDPFGNQRAGFEGTTTLQRSDFGLTWNAALETGGVLVSEEVPLEIEGSAIKNAGSTQGAGRGAAPGGRGQPGAVRGRGISDDDEDGRVRPVGVLPGATERARRADERTLGLGVVLLRQHPDHLQGVGPPGQAV